VIHLLIKEIQDAYTQENFKRIKEYFNSPTSPLFQDISTTVNDEAAKLAFKKVASEPITKFQMVRLISSTEVALGDISSYTNAKIIGMALESGSVGATIAILTFGIVDDASFSFTLNEPLFLQATGFLGETAPSASGEFIVTAGQSLGSGSIYIDISPPEEIA